MLIFCIVRHTHFGFFISLYEVKIEGFDSTMSKMIEKHFPDSRVLLVSNAEVIMHSNYGNQLYWMARRSMRFASHLIEEGLFVQL